MKGFIDIKQIKFYLWVGLAGLTISIVVTIINHPDSFFKRTLNHIWLMIYVIVFHYILFEYTIPFIKLTWKRLLVTPFLLSAHLIFYSFGIYGWRQFGVSLNIYTEIGKFTTLKSALAEFTAYSISSVLFFGIIKHIYSYIKLKNAAKQLRIEKQEAELNFLKSQTNPHFLFNTLNNIYSLARDKNDLAPESILRLSKILRFMLYDTNGEYITIEQELKIIEDYIALEKLRYDDSLRISFKQTIDNLDQPIPPLLLIPLVENAFKHGVSETRANPFIDIQLTIYQQQLFFVVKNSAEEFSQQRQVKENIGLSNLRRQLELLYSDYYLSAQQHEPILTASFLSAPKEEPFFITTLKINLASHV